MALHTAQPPNNFLGENFQQYEDVDVGRYRHVLLEAKYNDPASLAAALRPYFESAHLDARTIFHDEIGINLHPDTGPAVASSITYPNSLELSARRGLFGEVFAGLLTQICSYIGDHDWNIPVFLFRFHNAASEYLYTLKRDPSQERKLTGRTGDDFIAVTLDDEGGIQRVLAGEAKWRATLTQSVVDDLLLGKKVKDQETGKKYHNGKGILSSFNTAVDPPLGLKQLQKILQDVAPDDYAAAIYSIDQQVLADDPNLPRTNLIVLAGNGGITRENGMPMVIADSPPAEYTSPADLQVVEVIFDQGEAMVDQLYDDLWKA